MEIICCVSQKNLKGKMFVFQNYGQISGERQWLKMIIVPALLSFQI